MSRTWIPHFGIKVVLPLPWDEKHKSASNSKELSKGILVSSIGRRLLVTTVKRIQKRFYHIVIFIYL